MGADSELFDALDIIADVDIRGVDCSCSSSLEVVVLVDYDDDV
jgi:hypothetical protein